MKLKQMLPAIVLGAAISFSTMVWAQGGGAPTQGGDAPAQGSDASGNPDFSLVTKAVDTNGDGKMSREEWTSKGLPTSSFDMFENGRDYVTQKDYEENAAPSGIDINGDGKLTVEEFIEFDKSMSGGGAPGGDAPGGGAPPQGGGAPGGDAPGGGAPPQGGGAPGGNAPGGGAPPQGGMPGGTGGQAGPPGGQGGQGGQGAQGK